MLSDERREYILREIRASGFVHAADLADRLEVSRATVWRDIDRLAKAGAVAKVHGGASAPYSASASVATRGNNTQLTIGMQVPTSSYYYRNVIEGAREVCESFGARLVVGVSGYAETADDLESARGLLGVGADGLLLTPGAVDGSGSNSGYRELLGELDCPIVFVERDLDGIVSDSVASVTTAREAGVHSAVEHLAELGHRKIGFVAIRHASRSRYRIRRGYADAIVTLDVDRPPEPRAWEWYATTSSGEILDGIRAAGVTAVVVFGDTLAISLSHEAHRRGWSIPGDLSIISYDNEIAADGLPPLSAISPDRRGVGRTAARYLLTHLSGGEPLGGRRLNVQPSLVLRESTAPPAK